MIFQFHCIFDTVLNFVRLLFLYHHSGYTDLSTIRKLIAEVMVKAPFFSAVSHTAKGFSFHLLTYLVYPDPRCYFYL